jgi:hypothetical protein
MPSTDLARRKPGVQIPSPPPPITAAQGADHRGRGLDLELPLATYQLRRNDLEAVQAEQPGDGGTTVLTHLGLLLLDVRHPQAMRGPRCCLGAYGAVSGTSPRFMTKSPITPRSPRPGLAIPGPVRG